MIHDLHRQRNLIIGLMMVAALIFAALSALIGWGRPAIGDIADPYENPAGFLAVGGDGIVTGVAFNILLARQSRVLH
jgi:hypothetical protein